MSDVSPFDFVNQYHRDTISQNKALLHGDGSVTTVNAVGIPVGGKIYMVPGYDRDKGRMMNEREAYSHWSKKIPEMEKAGLIVGIPDTWAGDIKDHPANIMAQENHKLMDAEADAARKAVGYGRDVTND